MMRRSVQFTASSRLAGVSAAMRFGSTDYAWRNEEIERENALRNEASKGMSQIYAIKDPSAYVHCLPGGGSKGGIFTSSSSSSSQSTSSSGGGGSTPAASSSSPFAAIGSMFNNNNNTGGGGGGGGGGNDEDKKPEYKATMTDSLLLATGFVISVYSFKVMYNRMFGNHGDGMDSPVPIWVAGSPEIKGKYFLFSSITDAEERHRIFAEFAQARKAVIQQVIAHNQQVTHALRDRHQKQQQKASEGGGAADGASSPATAEVDEAAYQYIGIPAHFNDFFSWMDAVYPTWCLGRRFTNIPQIQSILTAGVQGMDSVGGAALHQAVSELAAETAAANRAAAAAEGKPVGAAQWAGLTSFGSPLSSGTIRDRTDRVDAFLEAAQKVTSGNGGLMSLFGMGGSSTPTPNPGQVPPFQQQQPYGGGGGGYYGMPPPQQQQGGYYNNTAPQQQYGGGNAYGSPLSQQQGSNDQQLQFAPPTTTTPQQQQYPPYSAPSAGALMNARSHMQQFHSPGSSTPVGENVNAEHNAVYHGSGTGFYGGGGSHPGGRPSTFTGSEDVSLQDVVGGDVVPQKGGPRQ